MSKYAIASKTTQHCDWASTHGCDSPWWTHWVCSFQPVLHNWCNKGDNVYIKDPLLLIIKNAHVMVVTFFLSRYMDGPLPYNHEIKYVECIIKYFLPSLLCTSDIWTEYDDHIRTIYQNVLLNLSVLVFRLHPYNTYNKMYFKTTGSFWQILKSF